MEGRSTEYWNDFRRSSNITYVMLTEDDLAIELKQPIVGCNNLEELLVLNAIHIPLHAGKIEEMSRILKNLK